MTGKVKWFSSENINAPELNNNWGSLLNVIKSCLIDGFGIQPFHSIEVSNGVAIATFPSNHNLQIFQWIEISGSSQTILNDEFKILGLTPNTIEFLVDLPDQTITEPMSCKLPTLGWSMPFSDTGRAVFRAKATSKNPYFLRVDDTCDPLHTPTRAKFAKVGILETCTGIDDISGNQAPFDPLLPTKNWIGTGTAGATNAMIGWARWVYATADSSNSSNIALTANAINGIRDWVLVGDDENFFILPATVPNHATSGYKDYSVCYGFGVFEGKDCPFLTARHDYNSIGTAGLSGADHTFSNSSSGYLILLKNRNGSYVTGSTVTATSASLNYGLDTSRATGYSNTYAENVEDGWYYNPFYARDAKNNYLGTVPLLRCVLQATPTNSARLQFSNDGNRALLRCKHMNGSLQAGSIIIDLGEMR